MQRVQVSLALALLPLVSMTASAQIVTASYWDQDQGRFGATIRNLGDLNGDGRDEMFVGEPRWDNGGTVDAGVAYVIDHAIFYWVHLSGGTQTDAEWGTDACRLGDVDGDDFGDFAISARYWDSATHADAGKVVGYSGKSGAVMWTFEGGGQGEEFGASLEWIGDIDGDGVDEIAATRPNDGEVLVLDGNGDKKYAIVRGPNVEFGAAIARCEDLDQDKIPDLIVGEPGYDQFFPFLLDCGRAVIYSGANGAWLGHVPGSVAGERLGSSVSGCGDVDDDGFGDFLTGAMETDKGYNDNGSVTLWSGATLLALQKVYGEDDDDRLGLRVVGLRDLDGDGVEDFMASAMDGGSTDLGSITIRSGADGHEIDHYDSALFAPPGGFFSEFGAGLCGGDWNGDEYADWAWGDPGYSFSPYGTLVKTGDVNTFIGCPAWAKDYGAGWPGRNGIPTLTAHAPPQPSYPISVDVSNSLGASTLALVMVGSQTAATPYKDGLLLTNGDLLSSIFSLDAAGTTLSDDLPADPALYFVDFYVQVIEADPFASKKISMTAGLHLRVGIDLD